MVGKQWIVRFLVMAALALAGAGSRPAQAASVTSGQWVLRNMPMNLKQSINELVSVAAISTTDVWAVGDSYTNINQSRQTLSEHWDGISWSIVPSPSPQPISVLKGVAAVSSSDVWAVGYTASQTLTEHWNGSAWSVVPSPNVVGALSDQLSAVTAISSSNVWAVGIFFDGNAMAYRTLIEHYDGASWSIVPSPNPSVNNDFLTAVSAASASDIWAVGYTDNGSADKTIVEHYNGSSWSLVTSPNPGSTDNLYGVAAISSANVWAVGSQCSPCRTLIEHYNGTSWSVVASPSAPQLSNTGDLFSIAAISSTDIWAVGSFYDPSIQPSPNYTLTEHWNGTTWSIIPSPSISLEQGLNTYDSLFGIATTGSSAFAVGSNGEPLGLQWYMYSGAAGPSVTVGAAGTDGTGHKYVSVHVQDSAGLLAIGGAKAGNCTLVVSKLDGFSWGDDITPTGTVGGYDDYSSYPPSRPTSADVTVTRVDNTKTCVAGLFASDTNYATTFLDPVLTPVMVATGVPMTQSEQITPEEHWATIQNLTPGLSQVTFVVNGQVFLAQGLHDGEQRVIDLSRALHAGMNTVQLVYLGRVGASAAILFSS